MSVAREARPIEALDRIVTGERHAHRIDGEGADDARVQALEVEDDDVVVQAGLALQDVAAGAGQARAAHRSDLSGDVALSVKPREIEVVERGYGAAGSRHGQARHPLARDRKPHHVGVIGDVANQATVLEVVAGEGGRILPPLAADRGDLVGAALGDLLASAEQLLAHVLEGEALEAVGGRLEGRDPVEDRPPRNPRDRQLGGAPRCEHRRALAATADREPQAERLGALEKVTEVELDDVPSQDDVRIALSNRGEGGLEQRALVARPGEVPHVDRRLVEVPSHEAARVVVFVTDETDRDDRASLAIRLDVQEQPS